MDFRRPIRYSRHVRKDFLKKQSEVHADGNGDRTMSTRKLHHLNFCVGSIQMAVFVMLRGCGQETWQDLTYYQWKHCISHRCSRTKAGIIFTQIVWLDLLYTLSMLFIVGAFCTLNRGGRIQCHQHHNGYNMIADELPARNQAQFQVMITRCALTMSQHES